MQFFEHQDRARGRTTLLVVLFSFSVLCLGVLSSLTVHFALSLDRELGEPLSKNHWSLVAATAIATWGVIALGSVYRMAQLGRGGQGVAEMLGGSLVNATTEDPFERRVINVVEEMAIAAGLPVPPVYLMRHEKGINAFAAGWSPDDAVIGVTQGALEGLKRDQLQGVIAHEFSHILNRDCALNMRLMGILHGIVVISLIGRMVMSMSSGSRHTSTRRQGGAIQIFVLGGAIWLFGSIGVLIARFIQSAVSHQREFLADASAVQFTRNPEGIAGALATIASQSSTLKSPRGSETSHMLIGDPGKASFLSALSSHPPLFERISRILPRWDGEFATLATPKGSVRAAFGAKSSSEKDSGFIPGLPQPVEAVLSGGIASGLVLEPVDSPSVAPGPSPDQSSDRLDQARSVLRGIPVHLRRAAETPFSCRAVLLALLLVSDATERSQNGETGGGSTLLGGAPSLRSDAALRSETERQIHAVAILPTDSRLPLFDIALSTLAGLSETQSKEFAQQIDEVAGLLFERSYGAYCMLATAERHLRSQGSSRTGRPMLIKDAIEVLLSVLAHEGHDDADETRAAFQSGVSRLGKRGKHLCLLDRSRTHVRHFDAALATLLKLPAPTRASLLEAAQSIAENDGVLRASEAQLLRAMAVSLNLAVPLEVQGTPSVASTSLEPSTQNASTQRS